jgi:hypothetical protein
MKNFGIPCSSVVIFEIGQGLLSSCAFSLRKSVKNLTVPSFFGMMKHENIWCNDPNVLQPFNFFSYSLHVNVGDAERFGGKRLGIMFEGSSVRQTWNRALCWV